MGKCTFAEISRFLISSHCKEFKDAYNKLYFSLIAKGEPYPSFIEVDTELYQKAGMMYFCHLKEEIRLQQTAFLNNVGSSFEKEGNIDKAIKAYEQCAAIGYKASHCYERLRILYKKRGDYDNMNRAIQRMEEVYEKETGTPEEIPV